MAFSSIISKYKEFSKEYGRFEASILIICKVLYRYILVLIICVYRRFITIKPTNLVFHSSPDYSDNSRALSDYLIGNMNYNSYRIFWAVNDVDYCRRVYDNPRVVFFKLTNKLGEYKLHSLKIIMSARILLGTHNTIISTHIRRRGQKTILLWHGCSFKEKTGDSIMSKKNFDYALVAGPLFVRTKSHYWNSDEKYILPLGYPRYDWLRYKTIKAELFKEKIKGEATKIIVWMPTFRNQLKGKYGSYTGEVNFPLIKNNEEWIELDKKCQLLGIKLVIKLHMYQKKYNINFSIYNNIVLVSNSDFDKANISMYSFLAVTDGLISDYSSVAVDYMIVDKPIAFVLDDFDIYKNKRGFVVDDPRKYMPGHHVYCVNDFFNYLEDVAKGRDIYIDRRHNLKNILVHESPNYCEEISRTLGI